MKKRETEKRPIEIAAGILFLLFVIFIYLYTVFFRPTYLVHNARWKLFWSYPLIWSGNRFMLSEVFYNLLMLIPAGLLWPFSRKKEAGWALAVETTVVGFICSFGIENLQLFLKRGLFEWDDMMHNTFGAMFGYCLYVLVLKIATKKKLAIADFALAIPFLINCIVLFICKIHMG